MNIFTYGFLPIKNFETLWINIKYFFGNLKFAWQRCVRGYADCDVWNMDTYLAQYIKAVLNHLENKGHGYPLEFTEEEWKANLVEGQRLANQVLNSYDETEYVNCLIEKNYTKLEKVANEMDKNQKETISKMCDWLKENWIYLFD